MLRALLDIGLGIAVVVLITAFTAYFVAQEFAYTAVNRSRLTARAQAGDASAQRALGVTRRTSFMLSGAQLGITVTGLLAGYVAEPLIGTGFAALVGGGVASTAGIAVGAAVSLLFCTLIQMLFGELVPKNLAIAMPEAVARTLATSTHWYLRLFGWLIALFDRSSNLLLRVLRMEPVHDIEQAATARDLEHIVASSRSAGQLPAELSVLLDRILDFPTSTAEHAMIPRTHVDTVRADESVDAVLTRMATGHTRYPVVGDSTDDLLGVLDLDAVLDANPQAVAGTRCRPAVRVPGSLPLPEVLNQLRAANDQMAFVIDEYGGFAGIVTIEDIAEEVVGEIADEHDGDDSGVVRRRDGWLLPGDMHVDEAQRVLDHRLPDGDYETLAGLLIEHLGRLPAVGDKVEIWLPQRKLLAATVKAVERRVPASVLVSVEDGDE
ncbi:hemolysin family protein [Mycobacterium sp. 3519A]|uniref:hemolysin family protein n=1 Tax=Mycobacterium sp. 3519A TaxID=2057184 RepID=UPI000C7CC602|nr:hemolysin family protein [Mycobacterium sp. 3519A]